MAWINDYLIKTLKFAFKISPMPPFCSGFNVLIIKIYLKIMLLTYPFNRALCLRSQWFNSTAIFNLILLIGIFTSSKDNALRWMPRDLADDKSTLFQVMAWCRQATSHYLSQCWTSSMLPNGVTRPHELMLIWVLSVRYAQWNFEKTNTTSGASNNLMLTNAYAAQHLYWYNVNTWTDTMY